MDNPFSISVSIFLITVILGHLCVRIIGPLGFMDIPGGRRVHTHPIPRVGGLACFIAVILCTTLLKGVIPLSPVQWVALWVTLLMGVLDDRFNLPARGKALVSLTVALILASASLGDLTGILSNITLFIFEVPYSPFLAFGLSLMLFWGIPQAFNLIDGANGLAIGYAFIVSIVLHLHGAISQGIPIILFGLLVMNWPKPKLFLGDCGSLTLGLLFAILAYKTFSATNANAILWIFAYPIIDVTMVVSIRIVSGHRILCGDRNHLHHQLIDRLGDQAFLAVPILWMIAGLCACRPLGWTVLPWASLLVLLSLALAFFGLGLKKRTADLTTHV